MSEMVLGTAQFGMDYGINNKRGKIPEKEAFEMLRYAQNHGIAVLDTAPAYGNSEEIIGRFIGKTGSDIGVISKSTAPNPEEVERQFAGSLKQLRLSRLYGYLVHSFQHYIDDGRIWDALTGIRSSGRVRKIGFSLYYPSELDILIKRNVPFDMVQVPYSIMDQRFSDYFPALKARGVEIHVRSVFLQGLLLKDASTLKGRFAAIRDKIAGLSNLALRCGVGIETLCLSFAALNAHVDKIVVGADSLEHLKKNIENMNTRDSAKSVYDELFSFRVNEEDIVVPSCWTV